jgi:hypothetical protein
MFSNQNIVRISHLSHACFMPHPSHLNFMTLIICGIYVTKLLIMQFSPVSIHFLPLVSIYSPQLKWCI